MEQRKRREKKERRSCPDWYVWMYGVVCIGTVWERYGTVRYGGGKIWLFLFVLDLLLLYGVGDAIFFIMISLLAKSTTHFAPQEVTQPSYLQYLQGLHPVCVLYASCHD